MAEYIDRETLYAALHDTGGCDAEKNSFADGWDKAITESIRLLMEHPAADVVEVVHGEWVLEYGDYGKMMCSVCKKEPQTEKIPDPFDVYQMTEAYITSDYCPNCGAKMDGKDGEGK